MNKLYFSTLTLLLLLAQSVVMAQSRSTFVHMKSGEIKEMLCSDIDSITFADHVDFDLDVAATHSLGIYRGSGWYVACISDGELDSDGLPTQAGQTVVLFYAFSDEATDPTDPQLTSGKYIASDDMSLYTLYNGMSGYCEAMYCTSLSDDGPEGWQIDLSYATMTVKNTNGQYYIDFRGGLDERDTDVDFKDIHMTFQGKITFQNQDPAYYEPLAQDYNVVPTGLSGRYTNSTSYGNYSLCFYNVPLDDDGFVVGAGQLINVELLTEPGTPMDIANIAGEYVIADVENGPYKPGVFLSGVNYYYYGMYFPMGTYLSFYDESGYDTSEKGFATGGSVKATVDGENVTFDLNVEVEGGHKFTMNYTGTASDITDYSSSSSAPKHAPASTSKFRGLKNIARINAHQPTTTLRLIKKK